MKFYHFETRIIERTYTIIILTDHFHFVNVYFKDFANPDNKKQGRTFESFNARFLDEIDFDAYWGAPHNRARLSSDPGNKFRTEKQD